MKKIIIASENPVKINATLSAFQKMFPVEHFEISGVSVSSGVNDQPLSDQETFQGAWNRAENASKETEADFWVGIEGGVEQKDAEMQSFAWVVVRSKDGRLGKARTAAFFLPSKVADLIKQGKELGEADDIVFGRENSKQINGAVGILTQDVITRESYYTDAIMLALIYFKNQDLYQI